MSNLPAKRSRNGCWTCKRRRRKCDETHPTCITCHENDLICEGYEPKLRWDIGVASRGYLTGASLPNLEHAPPRPKGRQRDLLKLERERLASSNMAMPSTLNETPDFSTSPASSRSNPNGTPDVVLDSLSLRNAEKESLFQEFLTSGIRHLHSTDVNTSPLQPLLPSLCQRSEALYDVCVTFQAYLSYGANSFFYELYSEALSKFRASIDHPLMKTDAAILNAALLLCTIGILQGTPWTIHIKGMEKLLDDRANLSPLTDPEPALTQAIEVMGIFDLPALVIGRQTPSLNVWRRYRLGQLIRSVETTDSVEMVTGIPRSMIDMLAYEDGQLTEEHLWLWPGCAGTLLQCQLWEAYKYAMMLDTRRKQRTGTNIPQHHSPIHARKTKLPDDDLLLTKALSAIDAVYNGARQPAAADSLVLNAILYPLFIVGIEVFMSTSSERQDLIIGWFNHLLECDPFANVQQAWDVLQAIATSYQEGRIVTADEVARFRHIELGLF